MKTRGSMQKCQACPGFCCRVFMIGKTWSELKHLAKHAEKDSKIMSDATKALKWFRPLPLDYATPDRRSYSWKLGGNSRMYTCMKLQGGECAVYHERPTCCEGFDCDDRDVPPFESNMLCGVLEEAIFKYKNYGPVYRIYVQIRNFIFLNWTNIPKYDRFRWLRDLRRKAKRALIPAAIREWIDRRKMERALKRMGIKREKREELYGIVEQAERDDCDCEKEECCGGTDAPDALRFAHENAEQSKARAFGRLKGEAILKRKVDV